MTQDRTPNKSHNTRGPLKNADRRLLLGSLGVTGSIVTVACWHKPIINSVMLPAHAQTTGPVAISEPVLLTTTAVADTDTGLFFRAAASGGEERKSLEVKVEIKVSRGAAEFVTAKEMVLVTDASGLARQSVTATELDMLAGDRYLVKATPQTVAAASSLTVTKGKMLASRSFQITSSSMEVSRSAIKAELSLSEAVRGTEWVDVNLAIKDSTGATTASKSLSLATKSDGGRAIVSLNLTEKDLAADRIKIPEKGSVALTAKMAQSEVFGSTALNVSKAVATSSTTRG